ncbi:hypothetical protein N3K63_05655 [Microbacterium sp. W1N]|uniref:hypothetical protein n=1 Tax=Microbacterium festucae TaxID=2977531 RepID=UPI0021BEE120|nr:hypothetical protein [Microbacterium festucae]MCT9819772.1 hypothetical protein [Microbacterium festucae]
MNRPRRRSRRPRRANPAPAAPAAAAPVIAPAWAGAPRGAVRWTVAGLAVAAVLAMSTLDPAVFLVAEPAFWLILLAGTGGGGLVASLRMAAFPIEAIVRHERARGAGGAGAGAAGAGASGSAGVGAAASGSRWQAVFGVLLTRTGGDAVWAVIIVTVGMVGRSLIAGMLSGWSPESIRSIIITPLMALMTFAGMWIAGVLIVLTVTLLRGLQRLRRAGRTVPAAVLWTVGVFAGLALFVPSLLAVGLSDTSGVSVDGLDAFVTFLVGDVWLEQAWQVVLLWCARIGFAVIAVSLVGVVVARIRTSDQK